MKKFFRVIYKIIIAGIIVGGIIVLITVLSFIHNLGKSPEATKQAKVVITDTPELLIVPPTPTQTEMPIPTSTPKQIRNAQIPIYNGNGELIGYMTTPTATKICLNIKGNVNSKGEKIYHCPHWRDYDITEIIPAEGDRYFCSEGEARAADFRAAEYPHGICR